MAAGVVSLCLCSLPIISKRILAILFLYQIPQDVSSKVITFLEYLGNTVSIVQVFILVFGTFLILPNVGNISFEEGHENYCQKEAVVASIILLGMSWFFIIFAFLAFLYLHRAQTLRKSKRAKHLN